MLRLVKVSFLASMLILFGVGCAKTVSTPEPLGTVQSTPTDNLPQDVEDLPSPDDEDTDEELNETEREETKLPIPDISQDEARPPSEEEVEEATKQLRGDYFIFKSSAFASGGVIPQKYSCDGQDLNPPLSWSGEPFGTKSFALIIDDPDAVQVVGKVVDHWVLWNIPAPITWNLETVTEIRENSVPKGASQGMSYDASKYQGPCPPPGTTHRYFFKLYALDVERLNLPSSTNGKALETAMQGHVLKKTEFMARFTAR